MALKRRLFHVLYVIWTKEIYINFGCQKSFIDKEMYSMLYVTLLNTLLKYCI